AFTADGTAIINVVIMNTPPKKGFIPVTNMWCPQTINDNTVIPTNEYTIAWYPKIGLREFVEIISEVRPNAGITTIYTSGWPKNQNKCWNKIGEPPSFGKISPWTTKSDR